MFYYAHNAEATSFDKYSSFKSKGEREIAEFFEMQQIAYQYEYPLAIIDRGKTKIWYPDFKLPEYGMILEYFGMNGDSSYNEQIAHKMKVYQEAGINGIYLIESTMRGPWQEMIIEKIEQALEGKLRKIQRHRMDMNLGKMS
ncbi:MAG: hypothetical protein A2Y10_13110 [Planctomycetes bacterium GWF2_41_51]|nr:MAG: hypothetical protein A2Y10_13110 [Planctomycetes bacterium GWF2_41_51]HBG60704.1 hypothetical protein [Candidatus Omnitrophota bacterium]